MTEIFPSHPLQLLQPGRHSEAQNSTGTRMCTPAAQRECMEQVREVLNRYRERERERERKRERESLELAVRL